MNTTYTFPTIHPENEHRVYFDFTQLMAMKRWLREENKTFVEGQDSLYCLNSKTKYILRDNCTLWPTLKGERMLMTPGEVARTELERNFGRKPDLPEKRRLDLLRVKPPRYWDKEVYEDCNLFYTDLNAAYWQCWRLLTLDCVWPRGMGELNMIEMGERLKNYKPGRNAISGITMSHEARMYHKGEWKSQPFYNPWFNPAIWAHLQAFVHEVAVKAIALGCRYVATDGYIFYDSEEWANFNTWLTDNDISYKVEMGEGYLTSWGSYKVGERRTKRKKYNVVMDHTNIVPHTGMVKWMLRRKRTLLDP